jgi:hypothetical protein
LAAAGKKMTCHATVAWRKRNIFRRIVTKENCGPHKELAAARIRTTRCAKVARGREHRLQRQGKDDIAPRPRKGQTEENKRLKGPECKNDVRYRELRQQFQGKTKIQDLRTRRQLRLKSESNSSEFDRKAFGLEFVKRANGMSNGFRRIRKWNL